MPRNSISLRSALAAAALTGVTSVASAYVAQNHGLLMAAQVVAVGVLATGAAVWAGLAPLGKLAEAAAEVADGSREAVSVPDFPGELATLVRAMRVVENQRNQLGEAYRADLKVIADTLKQLADPKQTPGLPAMRPTDPAAVTEVLAGFDAAIKDITATRHRLNWAIRVLAGIPDAVVATDGAGIPRYLNPAAEKLFRVDPATVHKNPVTALFSEDNTPVAAGDDPPLPVVGSLEIADWIRGGAAGTVTTRTNNGTLVEVAAAVIGKSSRDRIVCLISRYAVGTLDRVGTDRAAVREAATRRFLTRYLGESTEALAQIGAQLRLLTGEAKHSGHRDSLLGKLAAAGEGLRRLETFHTLADWFRATAWDGLPDATPSEFTPSEVAALVGRKLAARMKDRGNALKVTDQGGWMYADADRVEAALTGLLAHAGDAASNTQLELRVSRLPAGDTWAVPMTEFHLPDAGPALTAAQLAVAENPFGGLAPAPLDRFDGADGFPLGLAVAARLAPALDGELHLENGPAGQLSVRLIVPARRAAEGPPATVAAAAPGALDVAPAEETVAGWRLGVPSPQLPA